LKSAFENSDSFEKLTVTKVNYRMIHLFHLVVTSTPLSHPNRIGSEKTKGG